MQETIDNTLAMFNGERLSGLYQIDDKEMEYISKKQTYKIMRLEIEYSNITPRGFFALSNAVWTNLHVLRIAHTTMDDMSCKYLSRIALPNVEKMHIYANIFSTTGMPHISKSQWPNLNSIKIGDKLEFDSILMMARSNWPKLCYIGMRNKLTFFEMNKFVLFQFKDICPIQLPFDVVSSSQRRRLDRNISQKYVNASIGN